MEIEKRKRKSGKQRKRPNRFLFQNFAETSKGKKEVMRMMLYDIVGAEQRMKAKIEEILKDKTLVLSE